MKAAQGLMSALKKIVPEVELTSKDGYRWFVYSEKDTGLRLVCLEDLKTKTVLTTSLANPQKRIAAHKAWAGARHSRAPGEPWEIMHEMGERGVNPDKKLETTFKNYGHASVGDMASIQIDFVNVPIHFGYSLFNLSSINSGQEKSSRYQKKFGECVLHCLDNYLSEKELGEKAFETMDKTYQEFGNISLELYQKHKTIITGAFKKYYKPQNGAEGRSPDSRVMDCVRFFLLVGQDTGLSFETSVRDWVKIIAALKASPLNYYQKVGSQIEKLLTPSAIEEKKLGYKAEAPSLVEFTESSTMTNDNLKTLKRFIRMKTNLLKEVGIEKEFVGLVRQEVKLVPARFSAADKMVTQYLLAIWPGLKRQKLFKWIKSQKPEIKKKIGSIIFGGHSHHYELPDLAATTEISLVIDGFYGETLRDFNRHRAWGRFGSLPLVYGLPISKKTIMQILAKGFGLPLYLTEVERFTSVKQEFVKDLKDYYDKLYAFIDKIRNVKDFSFAINLLPMAHHCPITMHGNPKQAFYFTHLRTRNGGHINYRMLAYDANYLIADSNPYYEGLRIKKKPNPKSKKEFFDRG